MEIKLKRKGFSFMGEKDKRGLGIFDVVKSLGYITAAVCVHTGAKMIVSRFEKKAGFSMEDASSPLKFISSGGRFGIGKTSTSSSDQFSSSRPSPSSRSSTHNHVPFSPQKSIVSDNPFYGK